MRRALAALVFLLAACGGDDDASTPTSTTEPEPAETTTTTEPAPATRPEVTVAGPEEVVFDWTTDRCEDEHIPDIAPRAFRDAQDRVQLTIGHYVTYRMVGPTLDEVVTDCSAPVLRSDYDPDPAHFDDSEWIGSPYTLDGQTVYAVIHNEYRGDTHVDERPGQCPSRDRLPCLDTSFTMAISTDGGATFDDIVEPPGHLVATLPYAYADDTIPTGIRQPSNIVRGPDDFYYLFGNVSAPPDEEQWVSAMRTDDLADPTSWRYWDGETFAGRFVDPYRTDVGADPETSAPLALPQLSGTVQESLVFDESIDRWVMVGMSSQPIGALAWGVYYSTSEDLLTWTTRRLLIELPITASVANPLDDLYYAYPAILDPDSDSRNFETSDGSAHLYLSRFNAGGNSLDRDLIRWPIELAIAQVQPPGGDPPEFSFDTDGDTEGWVADNALEPLAVRGGSLITRSTGEDPWMLAGPLAIDARNDELAVRMRVSGGGETVGGELFFTTEESPQPSEATVQVFEVVADGEWQEVVIDLSDSSAWSGVITGLRFDPVPDGGRDIEIDSISFG